MKRTTIMTTTLSLMLLTTSALPLQAQNPAATFEDLRTSLRLKADEAIQITEANGDKYDARVEALTTERIIVRVRGVSRELAEMQVREIRQRRADKWWNGMLIGLGVGVGSAAIAVHDLCGANDSECTAIATLVFVPAFAGVGMGTAAAIDFAIRKHDTIFVRPTAGMNRGMRISPLLGRATAGVKVSFRF